MESEGSAFEELLCSARGAADFDDGYGFINDFIEVASAARPSLSSSSSPWSPSRFEGSNNADCFYLKTKFVANVKGGMSPLQLNALMDAPSPKPFCLQEESVEPLAMANRLSPPPSVCAFMRDSFPSPSASQINASVPRLLDISCIFEAEESRPLDYSLDSQTGMTPVGASVDALRPHLIRGLRHELMEPLSMRHSPSATQLSAATEFTSKLYASTPPVCSGPPHPPRLASQQFMSVTPSPVPPPTLYGSVGASVFGRSRAAAPIVFDQPVVSAPRSLPVSGGFGGFLRSTNEPLGFGSSATGLFGASLQQQQQQQQLQQQQQQQQLHQRIAAQTSEAGKLT